MTKKLMDVDDALWNKFKKKCVNNDITMKEQLNILVKGYVEKG